jgi:hypothetical protein
MPRPDWSSAGASVPTRSTSKSFGGQRAAAIGSLIVRENPTATHNCADGRSLVVLTASRSRIEPSMRLICRHPTTVKRAHHGAEPITASLVRPFSPSLGQQTGSPDSTAEDISTIALDLGEGVQPAGHRHE